jgi:hypothetical protein
MNRQSLGIVGAGLLGLLVAACLGFLALQLVSQPVGLSTVDAGAGDELVSKKRVSPKAEVKKKSSKKKPDDSVVTTPYVPSQDSSGSGGDDSSGSRGGDDSGGDDSGGDADD